MKPVQLTIGAMTLLVLMAMMGFYQQRAGSGIGSIEVPRPSMKTPSAAFERQQYFLQKRMPADVDQLPMDPYRDARQVTSQQAVFSTRVGRQLTNTEQSAAEKAATEWQWLGPGNIGGRTRALVFHPENSDVMYTAGVSGGIWKTVDAGDSWTALADQMANINVGALAIDPSDPNTLYAGTGELYRLTLRPYSSMTGAGMFKTTDGGQTWFQLEATVNDSFLYVSDIVISPNDSKIIYVATNTGVWRSTDGGINFNQSLNPQSAAGASLYEGCSDLSMRTDKPDDWLLVSCASRSTDDRYFLPGLLPDACDGPCDARIYLNTRAQATDNWQVTLTESGMGRTSLAIHQANQDIMYAASSNIDGGPDLSGDGEPDLHNGLHAIFRSTDGGQSWQARLRNTDAALLNTQLFSYADGALNSSCGNGNNWYYSAGWYNQAIAVSPTDPDVVWVGGMEIYRSDDGGANFGMASHWDALYFDDPAYEPAYVHADQHGLIFHPDYDGVNNKTLLAINDGGVFLTEDDSLPVTYGVNAPCTPHTTGIRWRSINNNYGVTQFYAGAVFSDATSVLAGAQDNGTQYGSELLGPNGWSIINGGDGGDLAINPTDDLNYLVSSQNANILRTTNGGNTFTHLWDLASSSPTPTPYHPSSANPNRIFITPFELDPNQPSRLFLGGQKLWRSDDQGTSWLPASYDAGDTFDDLISALAIAPGNSNRVLYGNSKIIAVVNQALDENGFFRVTFSTPRLGWVSSLAFEPGNQDVAYATYSTFGGKHVWKTTNGGQFWVPIDGSGDGQLPDVPVHKLVVDPNDPQRLYIGTDLGVFVTTDGGANWAVENTGFSQVIVEDLVIRTPAQGGDPQLFAFTYGRGVWKVPLAALDGSPDYVIDDQVSGVWYNSEQSGHGLQLEVLDIDGQTAVLAAWYAYLDGDPIWLIGVGAVKNNRVDIDMGINDNTGFPLADFDPEEVNQQLWGKVNLVLDSDRQGTLGWSSVLPEYNNGAMRIERLTGIANSDQGANGINHCHSGSWYNPDQDGHGFMAEVIPAGDGLNMLMTWYTYFEGQQYWILANGPVSGNTATMLASSSSGSSFPTDFNSDDVLTFEWGELRFTLLDDNNAVVAWDSVLPGFPGNELNVTRLTQLKGHGCD
ncbi:hypothetical protein ACFODZ_15755 [Marinicella sediminis]|uniref:Sortilin N-terminal domain-containing protein n=1 Tax=Marinicella sediminis TaxID=1792834 RepID=A0ABV7JC56_9GAMM|nr:hypothetical protein [Marinicella sediminis]